MASSGNRKHKNKKSSNAGSASAQSNVSQIDDSLATSTENQELNDRIKNILEELLKDRLNKENNQITELQNKIDKLEEQATQHEIKIKILEDKVMSK
jgi:CII-binding regulator of phage lambda lysogenization HflD